MFLRRQLVRLLSCFVFAAATLGVGYVAAEERYLDFVHKLQQRGYGELAVQYLEKLNRAGEPPEELREVWELELGKSIRISAEEAANSDQSQKRLAEALGHINKFLNENADHPAAADALGSLGDIATQ